MACSVLKSSNQWRHKVEAFGTAFSECRKPLQSSMKKIYLYILSLSFVLFILSVGMVLILQIQPRVVRSGSMSPTLNKGDLIFSRISSEYHLGDIISYQRSGGVVTHQIVSINKTTAGEYYQTQGLANAEKDSGLVAKKDVLGRTIYSIPLLGYLFLMPARLYLVISVWILSLTVIVLELREVAYHLRRELA